MSIPISHFIEPEPVRDGNDPVKGTQERIQQVIVFPVAEALVVQLDSGFVVELLARAQDLNGKDAFIASKQMLIHACKKQEDL